MATTLICTISMLLFFSAHVEAKEVKQIYTTISEFHEKDLFPIPLYIRPISGYTLEKTKHGCADKNKKIEFEANEIRAKYDDVITIFSDTKVGNSDMVIKDKQEILWNGKKALLVKLVSRVGNPSKTSVIKWILVVDMQENSWLLSGICNTNDSKRSEDILAMIKSACWPTESSKLRASLPTGIINTATTGMKLASLTRSAIIYTKDGKLPTKSKDESIFLISQMDNNGLITNDQRIEFAKNHIKGMDDDRSVEIISEAPVFVDSLPGVEVTAYLVDNLTAESGAAHLTLLFEGQDIYLMAGISSKNAIKNLDLFHNLASTYKRNH